MKAITIAKSVKMTLIAAGMRCCRAFAQQANKVVIRLIPFEYRFPVNIEGTVIKNMKEKIEITNIAEVAGVESYLDKVILKKSQIAGQIEDYRMYCDIYKGGIIKNSFYYSSSKLLVIKNNVYRYDAGLLRYILDLPKVKRFVEQKVKAPSVE